MMNAVEIRSGYKYFGSANEPLVVLNRLNMTVNYGSLYALLGPSGRLITILTNSDLNLHNEF
jgi:ABC-type multidrug transport system ATPase subunit